jgi:hypothetical protein
MHRVSIHKKLARCLTSYQSKKVMFFQGYEGRRRVAEFKALLDRYGDGIDEDLKPIYHFFLRQNESSLLRNIIKSTLCDLLEIPLPAIANTYVSVRNPYSPTHIAELIQDRQLHDKLFSLIHDSLYQEVEMEIFKSSNKLSR